MHTLPFAEYRCDCGRLLFKGLVLSGHVQVKCKRCSQIVLFEQPPHESPPKYSIVTDANGYIKDASVSALGVLGYSREEVCALTIRDVPTAENAIAEVMHISTPEPLNIHLYRSL